MPGLIPARLRCRRQGFGGSIKGLERGGAMGNGQGGMRALVPGGWVPLACARRLVELRGICPQL